jgi:hypothetical protein
MQDHLQLIHGMSGDQAHDFLDAGVVKNVVHYLHLTSCWPS